MNRFIALTKVLIKTNIGSIGRNNGKLKLKGIAFIIFLLLCFMPLAFSIAAFVKMLYEGLYPINQQSAILGLGFSVSNMIVFFFGIFYVIGTFYFAMDIDYLLPLPFKGSQILSAKLVVVMIYEYLTQLIFLAPIIITYGYENGSSLLYYILGILVFLILPIIPLIISSILVMIIMRFTSVAKNKDRFGIIAGILTIFISLGINMVIQNNAASFSDPAQIEKLFMQGNNSLLNLISMMFPTSKFAALALAENSIGKGLINFGLFVIITIAAISIFIILGEGLYLKGVIGISQTTSKRKELNNYEISKATKENSLIKSYTLKELKILFRTPSYFMNCVLMNFLWPVFLLFPLVFGSDEISLSIIKEFFSNSSMFPIVLAVSACAIAFITSTNGISATAISREGKNLFINKFIPVDYKTQIFGKVLSGVIMGIICMAVLIITLFIIAKPSLSLIALILIVGFFVTLFVNFIGILIDLYNPKLNWDNEQKAVKQNMNVVISWIPCLLVPGLTVFLVIFLKLTLIKTTILLLALYCVLDLILFKLLTTKGIELFSNL